MRCLQDVSGDHMQAERPGQNKHTKLDNVSYGDYYVLKFNGKIRNVSYASNFHYKFLIIVRGGIIGNDIFRYIVHIRDIIIWSKRWDSSKHIDVIKECISYRYLKRFEYEVSKSCTRK